jgi:hypothetical protein
MQATCWLVQSSIEPTPLGMLGLSFSAKEPGCSCLIVPALLHPLPVFSLRIPLSFAQTLGVKHHASCHNSPILWAIVVWSETQPCSQPCCATFGYVEKCRATPRGYTSAVPAATPPATLAFQKLKKVKSFTSSPRPLLLLTRLLLRWRGRCLLGPPHCAALARPTVQQEGKMHGVAGEYLEQQDLVDRSANCGAGRGDTYGARFPKAFHHQLLMSMTHSYPW